MSPVDTILLNHVFMQFDNFCLWIRLFISFTSIIIIDTIGICLICTFCFSYVWCLFSFSILLLLLPFELSIFLEYHFKFFNKFLTIAFQLFFNGWPRVYHIHFNLPESVLDIYYLNSSDIQKCYSWIILLLFPPFMMFFYTQYIYECYKPNNTLLKLLLYHQ